MYILTPLLIYQKAVSTGFGLFIVCLTASLNSQKDIFLLMSELAGRLELQKVRSHSLLHDWNIPHGVYHIDQLFTIDTKRIKESRSKTQ